MNRFFSLLAGFTAFTLPKLAFAAAGQDATPMNTTIWSSWLPEAVTPSKVHIHQFNDLITWIIGIIVLVVGVLLAYTLWRFRSKRNPEPSKTTHHVMLEIIWTLIPCLILLIIVVPSLRLMYFMDRTAHPDLTLKATGYQWYWGYSYPEQGIDEYSVNIIPTPEQDPKHDADALRALPTYQRLLSTYDLSSGKPAFVVVPVGKNVRVLTTSNDVIHSWALPSFGIKKDAVPGRVNETWFRVDKPGIYYGQCSQICGMNHGYMPIEIRAVPNDQFTQWVALMKTDEAKAMDYIQTNTVQYAHTQLVAPDLTIPMLWDEFKNAIEKK
jgi:cytochrome c oxidase subunit 2